MICKALLGGMPMQMLGNQVTPTCVPNEPFAGSSLV